MLKKTLFLNGVEQTVIADPETTLAKVIRNQLGLLGTKVGCNKGQCGTCAIIMNGKVVRSCIQKFKRIPDESKITTIEGVGCLDDLHPLQLSWMIHLSLIHI